MNYTKFELGVTQQPGSSAQGKAQSFGFLWNELADNTRISSSLSFRAFLVNEDQWRDKNFDYVLLSKVYII